MRMLQKLWNEDSFWIRLDVDCSWSWLPDIGSLTTEMSTLLYLGFTSVGLRDLRCVFHDRTFGRISRLSFYY